MGRFDWTKEEMILAADLAARRNWKGVRSNTPGVPELSTLLRMANFHPRTGRPENFRSANSVGLKVNNLIAGHPESTGKGLRNTEIEREVVDEFLRDPRGMRRKADEIRASIERGFPTGGGRHSAEGSL